MLLNKEIMNKGTIIMLAWPKTPAIQVGSWYEGFMKLLGFNKNGYYMAGHSAIVLVEPETGELHYFDFGRYHAPLGHGRVRNKVTDPDLNTNAKAMFNEKGSIINLHKILLLLDGNKDASHGKNTMYASVHYGANFQNALEFAEKLQSKGAIPYGPFDLKGTNCSRFTSSVFRAGSKSFWKNLRLLLPTSTTPTTLGNVFIASTSNVYYEVENNSIKEQRMSFTKQLKNWIIPSISTRKDLNNTGLSKVADSQSLINA